MPLELWHLIVGGLITLAGSLGVARYSGKSSVRVKELDVDGQAYLRAKEITAGLIDQLRKQLDDMQLDRDADKLSRAADKLENAEQLRVRDERLDRLEKQFRIVSHHNEALTTFIYLVIAILRRHGLLEEINSKDVPDGIRI